MIAIKKKRLYKFFQSFILIMCLFTAFSALAIITQSVNVQADTILKPPVYTEDSSSWDCVYFGSYPQTEIIDDISTSGGYGRVWLEKSDYIIDKNLYSQLKDATFDINGNTTINGVKYKRINQKDSLYVDNDDDFRFCWRNNNPEYRYFVYEKIKWRVLEADDGHALLLADKGLDCQRYNEANTAITWEKSTIRSWLNGYDRTFNNKKIDYSSKNFIDSAFSSSEQSQILTSKLINESNSITNTEGGNDTDDKVFLLAESDLAGTSKATEHGFSFDNDNRVKRAETKTTSYTKARGDETYPTSEDLGNCYWWLRSPGRESNYAAAGNQLGTIMILGDFVDNEKAVRPALYLNTDSSVWEYAGCTECNYISNNKENIKNKEAILSQTDYEYDGTAKYPEVYIDGLSEGFDFRVSYTDNLDSGTASAHIIGIGKYKGNIYKEYNIKQASLDGVDVELPAISYKYTGEQISPIIKIKGLIENKDFTVSYQDNKNAGTATIQISGKGNYSGSVVKHFTIEKASLADMQLYVDADNCIYDGNSKTPEVKIGKLVEGVDFIVEYENNINAGVASATVNGIENCIGSQTVDFRIKPADLSENAATIKNSVYVYNGSAKAPSISVKGLVKDKDYKISYVNNKNVGKAYAKIIGINNYTGTIYKYYKIIPKGTYITSVRSEKKAFTLKWKKQAEKMSKSAISGYQICYSKNSNMSKANYVTVKGCQTISKRISKLYSNKKYYIKIRTFTTVNGAKYYSNWSTKKYVRTK